MTESVTEKRVQDGKFIRVCENEPEEYEQSQEQNVTGEDQSAEWKRGPPEHTSRQNKCPLPDTESKVLVKRTLFLRVNASEVLRGLGE